MCFSFNASTFMFILGNVTAIYSYYNINYKIAFSLFYFSIMQLLHMIGYLTINKCSNNINQYTSYLNYIHICFQPLIWLFGLWGLYEFIGNNNKESLIRIYYALILCFIAGIFLLLRLFNIPRQKLSLKNDNNSCMWCGPPCSFKGKKHINFTLPLRIPNYFTPSMFIHAFLFFIVPLFINKFFALITLILALTTFIPAYYHKIWTSEAATIWCFTAIMQIISTIIIALYWKKIKSKYR